MEQSNIAVGSFIPMNVPQVDRMRRSHKSLPTPMNIRITFEDSNQKKSIVDVSYVNPPLDLITKEKRLTKSNASTIKGATHDFFIMCDDVELETRILCEAFINQKEKRVEIAGLDYNKSIWLNQMKQKELVFQAVQEKKEEIELTRVTWNHEAGMSIRAYLLVDLKNSRGYAVKFVLKTTTGGVTDYFLLPKFPPPAEE